MMGICHISYLCMLTLSYAEWGRVGSDELDMRLRQTGNTDPRKPIVPTAPNKTPAKKCQGKMALGEPHQMFLIELLSLKSLVCPGQLLDICPSDHLSWVHYIMPYSGLFCCEKTRTSGIHPKQLECSSNVATHDGLY